MKKHEGIYTVRTEGALNLFTYAVSAIAFVSVVMHVGIVFSLPFICMFGAAMYFDYHKRYTIYRMPLNIALLVFIGITFLRISLDDFAAPLVETLLILLAVKLIEEKKARDYLQIYMLSIFILTGSALLSLDIQFIFILLLLALLLPVGIVLITFHSQQSGMMITNRDLRSILSRALFIALVSIPVTAMMFVILPRTGFPMLNIIAKSTGSTGFSESVRLGDISGIQENNATIMRVETEKIDPAMLYWRGIVLDYFDGSSWKKAGKTEMQTSPRAFSGKKVSQVIYLEPYENRYLFALDKPASVHYRRAFMSDDLTISVRKNIEKLVRYDVVSVLTDTLEEKAVDRKRYLQMPERDFSRVKALVRELSAGKDRESAVQSILQYLKRGSFSYSLNNLPITENPVGDFLFIHKYGNCEYFASSMAVMLRLDGIPARLVGGYLGGQYNDFGRYYLVTQNTAHVWVEVYIEGKGWLRMDPTPEGRDTSVNLGQKGLLWKVRLFLDFINYYWNSLIIDYDFDKQISVFVGLRNLLRAPLRSPLSFSDVMPVAAYAGAAIVILAILIYALLKRKPVEKRLVKRFVTRMKKRGYERVSSEGLDEFARRVDDPAIRGKALRFASEFNELYYRDKKMTRNERADLKRLIDEI
jgi:protein-glutamine gamma-glutamyltransferase